MPLIKTKTNNYIIKYYLLLFWNSKSGKMKEMQLHAEDK